VFVCVSSLPAGFFYLFRNNSKDVHLDTELEFKMTNLVRSAHNGNKQREHICALSWAMDYFLSSPPALDWRGLQKLV
jgi:hypothetical protein